MKSSPARSTGKVLEMERFARSTIMKLCLIRTKNGWIVTDQDFLLHNELPTCYVFESMRAVTDHLLKVSGETGRDTHGRFRSTKKEAR